MHIDVTVKEGVWIDIPKFFKQIGDAGYGPRKDDVRLTLTGKVMQAGDRLLLIVDDVKPGPQKFVLLKGESKDETESRKFADAYKEAEEKIGQKLEIEGQWRPGSKEDKNALAGLVLTRIRLVKTESDTTKP